MKSVAIAALSCIIATPALAGESTMPNPPYVDSVSAECVNMYTYTEDGEYTRALNIPTYEWKSVDQGTPKAVFLGIHGLTLHGRRFRTLARALAVCGADFISFDMRGFGRCLLDKQFSTAGDDRLKISHEKSYEDIVKLAQLIRQKYPNTPLIVLGESLGCTFCVKLAAEHPELADGIVLSAPAVHINKDMYAGHGQVVQGVKAVLSLHHEMDLRSFFAELCSKRADVQNEMIDDPLVLKKLPLGALISTDEFVAKTAEMGKTTSPKLKVLIMQGSADGCVSPKHVTDLMNNMPSPDQTLSWHGKYGHLQLETSFMRAQSVNCIVNWIHEHNQAAGQRMSDMKKLVTSVGGTITE